MSPRNELKWQVSVLPLPQTESIEKLNTVQTSSIIKYLHHIPIHSPYHRNLWNITGQGGMKVRENRKITAQGSAKNGTMKVHGHLGGVALFRCGTCWNLKKITKRVENSEAITLSEIMRNYHIFQHRDGRNIIGLVKDTFRTAKLASAADFDRCASVGVCKMNPGILQHAPATC